MAVYDSKKVREIATLMRRLAGCVDGDVKSRIRTASECADAFRGRTARAMEDRLAQLLKSAGNIGEEIETLARQVNAYADMLEQADRELAEKL